MKCSLAFVPFLVSCAAASPPAVPLSTGQYTFQHRYAEHPDMPSVLMVARIDGTHITLVNNTPSSAFPKGVVAEGVLMWHAASKQWIIGQQPSDGRAKEVGGCSDGPEVVDLKNKVYWTC
jgi:hypothetical protein